MTDLTALAELSHALEQAALDMAKDGLDARLIAQEVEIRAGGEREAIAIALSYLLRHRALGEPSQASIMDVAIDAAVIALRRAAEGSY